MYQFVFYVKTLAAFLITNSHCDNLYPNTAFSIGGALGNVLFFLASGYLLSNKRDVTFLMYFKKKTVRIYSSLWPITLLLLLLGQFSITSIGLGLRAFLFPYNSFWFITAILMFYVLFYFLLRYGEKRLPYFWGEAIVLYFFFYFTTLDLTKWSVEGAGFFKYIFYFQVMLIGYFMKQWIKKQDDTIYERKKRYLLLSVLFLMLYLVSKILVQKSVAFRSVQFMVQFLTLAFGICCFLFFRSMEASFQKIKETALARCIEIIGSSTLEIYLLNYLFVTYAEQFAFPINILIAFILIFSVGSCTHLLIDKVLNRVSQ